MTRKEQKELDDFAAKLTKVKERTLGDDSKSDSRFSSGWGLGVRLATELLGGVVVGAGIGLLLDSWFSTKPLFVIIFLLFGTAAGILNVYRVAAEQAKRKEKR